VSCIADFTVLLVMLDTDQTHVVVVVVAQTDNFVSHRNIFLPTITVLSILSVLSISVHA